MASAYDKERKLLAELRVAIDEALGPVRVRFAARLGGKLDKLPLGRCSFNANGFTFKIEGLFPSGKSKEERDYEMLREFGRYPAEAPVDEQKQLPPLGTELVINAKRVPIVGGRERDYELLREFGSYPAEQKKLPPLGTELVINAKRVTIVGGRARAEYNVIVRKATDGKLTCYRASDIVKAAGRAELALIEALK